MLLFSPSRVSVPALDQVERLGLRVEVVSANWYCSYTIRRLKMSRTFGLTLLAFDHEILAHLFHDLQAVIGPAKVAPGLLATARSGN